MKTHTIKTPTAELLIVELPEGGEYSKALHAIIAYGIMHDIPDDYTLLGKPDEISEDDVRGLVDSKEAILSTIYRNYNGGTAFGSRLESFFSLIESEIYWENPYSGVLAMEFPTAFDNFQLRTFDRNRTIILKKN